MKQPDRFFSISPLMIFPQTSGTFGVFLKQGDEYVLYANRGEAFTDRHRQTLHDNGIKEVYVKGKHKREYDEYVERNLGFILADENIPPRERSRVLYTTSAEIMEETFTRKLPENLGKKHMERVAAFVRKSARYLSDVESLKTMAEFISHDYKTYSHCVNVFIYTMAILSTYELDDDEVFHCGMGAMLHDIGKMRISLDILNKPGKLEPEERTVVNQHSMYGVALTTHAKLHRISLNCILFHHEKLDGSGYPAQLQGDAIPLHVRVVTVADVYDAITSDRPYAAGAKPYQALRIMRDEMAEGLDLDVLKRLIVLLSGAELLS